MNLFSEFFPHGYIVVSGVSTNTVITTKKISHNTCFELREVRSDVCLGNLDVPSSGESGDFPMMALGLFHLDGFLNTSSPRESIPLFSWYVFEVVLKSMGPCRAHPLLEICLSQQSLPVC